MKLLAAIPVIIALLTPKSLSDLRHHPQLHLKPIRISKTVKSNSQQTRKFTECGAAFPKSAQRIAPIKNTAGNDSPSNWWLIIPTIVISGATVVQVWIYYKQRRITCVKGFAFRGDKLA